MNIPKNFPQIHRRLLKKRLRKFPNKNPLVGSEDINKRRSRKDPEGSGRIRKEETSEGHSSLPKKKEQNVPYVKQNTLDIASKFLGSRLESLEKCSQKLTGSSTDLPQSY